MTPRAGMAGPAPGPAGMGAVRWWLAGLALMVAAMIVIGGVTRLTGSGLSMVEWRPATGWLPPLGDGEWARVFALYQASPEFQTVNSWMALADFKAIYWWEYIHRLWGRLIGLAFILPFIAFLVRRRIGQRLAWRLLLLLVLGGAQGAIGWWMVQSGLADEPAVSPWRLAVHLGLALLILGLLVWFALDLQPRPAPVPGLASGLAGLARLLLAAVAATALAGAFVAALDAGKDFNSFPLMAGALVPPGYGELSPWWRNPVENPAAAQFHHRLLAMASLLLAAVLWWRARAAGRAGRLARAAALAVALQFMLGVVTLLAVAPVWLSILHQAAAVAVFTLTTAAAHHPTRPNGRDANPPRTSPAV